MVKVIDYTKKPLTNMGIAAATCWNSNPSPRIGVSCIESGHHRVLEYADVTVEISGYSARAIRQLYTHRVGITLLQSSTRYVDESGFEYFTPPKIEENDKALGIYDNAMETVRKAYKELLDCGIPKEDAANLLTLGMDTTVVLKINARALLHLANLRLCTRAYHEIRKLVRELIDTIASLDEEWATICKYCVPKCDVVGFCDEKHSCGRKPKLNQ